MHPRNVMVSRRHESDVGNLIRQLRRNRGWTQKQLARKAGVTERTISNLERNANPNPHSTSMTKVATALGIPPERLDARQLAEAVAESAKSAARREAIRRLLALPEKDLEAILNSFDKLAQRAKERKR